MSVHYEVWLQFDHSPEQRSQSYPYEYGSAEAAWFSIPESDRADYLVYRYESTRVGEHEVPKPPIPDVLKELAAVMNEVNNAGLYHEPDEGSGIRILGRGEEWRVKSVVGGWEVQRVRN